MNMDPTIKQQKFYVIGNIQINELKANQISQTELYKVEVGKQINNFIDTFLIPNFDCYR